MDFKIKSINRGVAINRRLEKLIFNWATKNNPTEFGLTSDSL